jgi:proteasome lid subunit RPN8/RPN11
VQGVVEIRRAVLEAILRHADEERPNECCGLLIGTAGRVERAARARNLHASPTRYQVDPADHFAAIRAARADGLAVVGAYHSHPASPPVPSATDLAEALYPEFLYLIVRPPDAERPAGEVRGYRLVDGRFVEVGLAPVP